MQLTDPLRYDNPHDVSMRLNGCVARYKGEPVILTYIGDDNVLHVNYRPLRKPNAKWQSIHSSDVELDISSPPLGYLNHVETKAAYYVQRVPVRKQFQGFHSDNSNVEPECEQRYATQRIYHLIKTPEMADTIDNKYPSGDRIIEMMLSDPSIRSMAFHRKFAIRRDEIGIFKLRHMTRTIGFFEPRTNKCVLPEPFTNPIFERQLAKHGLELRT
jgi:hypothetical protein